MSGCLYLVALVGVATGTGVGGIAVLGAGGSGNCALILMSERISLCFSALTGSGGGACRFAEHVLVTRFCSGSRLLRILFSLARSKAENNYRKHKHKQHK